MPKGLGFLNVKPWHPANKTNQRRIWLAEQKYEATKRSEEESRTQLQRELDTYQYEQMAKKGDGIMGVVVNEESKKESSNMAFMYARPPGIETVAPPTETDDEAVKAFYKKQLEKKKRAPGFSMNAKFTELEKQAGKRKRDELTIEEQVERFPFLKNAPLEGDYAKDVKLTFKPFNKEVRNVKCMRCGAWGHKSGDRECPMADYNPHDAARQKREDPLTYMQNDLILEKQKLVLKLSALPREMAVSAADPNNQPVFGDEGAFVEDEGFGDVDDEFLATLSTKEKKALLKRLKKMESGGGSDGAGEGEGSADDAGETKKDKKKHHKKHKHRKSKKDKKKPSRSGSQSRSSSAS